VFFPGYGWLAFEPTPGRTNPLSEQADTYLNPGSSAEQPGSNEGAQGAGEQIRGGPGGTCTDGAGQPLPSQLCNVDPIVDGRPGRDPLGPLPPGVRIPNATPDDQGGYSIPYRTILLFLLVLAAVVLVLVPIVKGAWRGLILRRPHEPRGLVLAAHRVFEGEAADLGLGRRPGETLEEHRARLAATVAFSDGHLVRLMGITARAAYGSGEPTESEARAVIADVRAAVRDLRRDAGWLRRIAGTYRPGL
jgi:hypothetical protein